MSTARGRYLTGLAGTVAEGRRRGDHGGRTAQAWRELVDAVWTYTEETQGARRAAAEKRAEAMGEEASA